MGMDGLLSSLAEEEAHVHLYHFSEPSKSTFAHGYVSAKISYVKRYERETYKHSGDHA